MNSEYQDRTAGPMRGPATAFVPNSGTPPAAAGRAAAMGVWRCGKHLVVDLAGHAFADRCVWTNDALSCPRRSTEFMAEDPGRWQFLFPQGVCLGKRFHPLKLQLPVAPQWSEPVQLAKRRLGKKIFRISALLALIGFVASACSIAFLKNVTPDVAVVIAVITSIPLVFGMIGVVVGLAWPYLEGVPGPGGPLPAKRTEERFLWIEGASPAFLAELSPWPGLPLDAAFKRPETLIQYLIRNWPFLLLVVLLLGLIKVALLLI